jgi:hypothetical protein
MDGWNARVSCGDTWGFLLGKEIKSIIRALEKVGVLTRVDIYEEGM